MENWSEFPLHGSALSIVRQCGPSLGEIVDRKFGCVTTIDGLQFESGSSAAGQKKPVVVEEKRFSVKLDSGVEVSVWRADLTKLKVDAVVNAANDRLQHYGGLAQALSEAGGPRIQQESDDYIKLYGELKPGLATLADSGFLPCNMIIHAVGPRLPGYSPDVAKAEPLLKQAIWSILDIVKHCPIKTVAIPAISSGLFNYPLDQCARTIVSSVRDYCQRNFSKGRVLEILLANHDEPTVREMENACRQILAPQTLPSHSQAAGSSRTRAAKTSALTLQLQNVLLTLMKGRIEEQQTDVIVNTLPPDGNLQSGALSKALVNKAGPKMQRDIPKPFPVGRVVETNGYGLDCLEVFHTCCFARRDNPKQKDNKVTHVVYQAVSDCLKLAVSNRHASISFPAIGTGGLRLDKKDVAFNMFQAVVDFTKQSQKEIAVNFVIYPFEHDTYEAFETQMKCLQQQSGRHSVKHGAKKSDAESKEDVQPPRPRMTLISGSSQAVDEAQRWLSKLLDEQSRKVQIYNNFIQHFGEQEYKQLARLKQNGVSVQESFEKGRVSITVKGRRHEDVVVAALQVEALLCLVQKDFITEEMRMFQTLSENVSYQRENISIRATPTLTGVELQFKDNGLQVLKTEKVKNPELEKLFESKKSQINCFKPRIMFQRVPAQFCDMVCQVGFHAECAPPEDPQFGEGIYFARKVDTAMKLWKEQNEEYLYFVEAEVLRGRSARGEPGLILPPALEHDPQSLYDSVDGGDDVTVIFSSYQALPRHIFTCTTVQKASLHPSLAGVCV